MLTAPHHFSPFLFASRLCASTCRFVLLTFTPSSAYVRKTTALAIPKLVSLDQVRQQ